MGVLEWGYWDGGITLGEQGQGTGMGKQDREYWNEDAGMGELGRGYQDGGSINMGELGLGTAVGVLG